MQGPPPCGHILTFNIPIPNYGYIVSVVQQQCLYLVLAEVELEQTFEGNFSPLQDIQLNFQSSHIVLHWNKVSLLMRDSIGT